MLWKNAARRATTAYLSPNAAQVLATTIWWSTCARWPSCASLPRWYSTPPTRCNCLQRPGRRRQAGGQRRTTGIHSCAFPGRGGRRSGWCLHGSPRQSQGSQIGWRQCAHLHTNCARFLRSCWPFSRPWPQPTSNLSAKEEPCGILMIVLAALREPCGLCARLHHPYASRLSAWCMAMLADFSSAPSTFLKFN